MLAYSEQIEFLSAGMLLGLSFEPLSEHSELRSKLDIDAL